MARQSRGPRASRGWKPGKRAMAMRVGLDVDETILIIGIWVCLEFVLGAGDRVNMPL